MVMAETDPTAATVVRSSISPSRRGRRLTIITALVLGSILPVAAFAFRGGSPGSVPQDGESSSDGVLLGDALAQSLGLKLVSSVGVTGCNYFAESQPYKGYCLDAVVDNGHDAEMLGIQIAGREPTTIDERIFNVGQQLSALPEGSKYDDQRRELSLEMQQLLEQQGG